MLGMWIPFRLDPDYFVQIRILERDMAVCSLLDSELQQSPPDLRTMISHL
jgi:hypothetical protein